MHHLLKIDYGLYIDKKKESILVSSNFSLVYLMHLEGDCEINLEAEIYAIKLWYFFLNFTTFLDQNHKRSNFK